MTQDQKPEGSPGANEVPDYVAATRSAMEQYKPVEDRIKVALDIGNLIGKDNYVAAGVAVESLPSDFPKGPIYAAMAISLAERLERKEKTEGISCDLITRMIEYCKGKTEYFNQDVIHKIK